MEYTVSCEFPEYGHQPLFWIKLPKIDGDSNWTVFKEMALYALLILGDTN